MLAALTRPVGERISALNRFLCLCDACDEAYADPRGVLHAELSARFTLPSVLTEDRVFRHCAIVTALYTIYENFSEGALAHWLTRLPRYRAFLDLPQSFRNAYRYGVSQIVKDADKRRFRHLALIDVLANYLSSLRGECPWEFVSEALTTHDRNLRRGEFIKMFHAAGLDGVWTSVERHPSLVRLTSSGDGHKSLEQMILELVTYRNDASHGTPDEILGSDALREWIVFVETFCEALASFVSHRIVREEVSCNPASVYGVVSHTFKDNVAIINCDHGCFQVGDDFYFLRKSDCTLASITSLRLNNVDESAVAIRVPGTELGVQTSVSVRRGAQAVRIDDNVAPPNPDAHGNALSDAP